MLLATRQVDEISHVGMVEDGEVRGEAEGSAVQSQQAVGNGVEGAAPHLVSPLALVEAIRSGEHLFGGAAREGQQENALGWDALFDQVGYPARKGPGLAGASAGDNQDRAVASGDGLELFRVERCLPVGRRTEHVFEYTT